jgi:deoxyribonuclease-4
LGAKIVVFHAGYYQKYSKSECYEIIKREIGSLMEKIKERNWRVKLAPETTGKPSQFGSLDEILSLMEDLGTDVCIDFAHINARDKGIDYSSLFDRLEKLKKIHSHFSGIEYTQKGERRHLVVERNDFLPLANEILKRKINITIISESPITWRDSLKMKGIMEELMNFNKSTSSIS